MNADSAVPFDSKKVSFSKAAASLSNPFTAIGMVDHIASKGHKIFVHTAGASTMGRLLWQYAQKQGVQMIHVVLKQGQVDFLKNELGAKYVLNSSTDSFKDDLKALMKETNCTFMCDAVAGDVIPDTLLKASPKGSTLCVYGALAGDYVKVSGSALIGGRKVESFTTLDYMKPCIFGHN